MEALHTYCYILLVCLLVAKFLCALWLLGTGLGHSAYCFDSENFEPVNDLASTLLFWGR